MTAFPIGTPGIRTERTSTPRSPLLTQEGARYFPSARVVNGSLSRDDGNTGDLDVLRAGLLMGRITSSGKYAPAILGISQNAYTSGGTTITVTPAQAVEIVRRVGSSGNLSYIGGTSANIETANLTPGIVTVPSVAFSAVNTGTGAITVTSLGVNLIAGGWVVATDGSGIPRCIQGKEDGLKVTDEDGTSQDTQFAHMLIGGTLNTAEIPNWPTDTQLLRWVQQTLNLNCAFSYSASL